MHGTRDFLSIGSFGTKEICLAICRLSAGTVDFKVNPTNSGSSYIGTEVRHTPIILAVYENEAGRLGTVSADIPTLIREGRIHFTDGPSYAVFIADTYMQYTQSSTFFMKGSKEETGRTYTTEKVEEIYLQRQV